MGLHINRDKFKEEDFGMRRMFKEEKQTAQPLPVAASQLGC